MDELIEQFVNEMFRLTIKQTFKYHDVVKKFKMGMGTIIKNMDSKC